ncbi:MAG: riboflavin synthase [Candidatus Poribacteria bacterium]|nr:riboflavin synthase [Candidatus Poribacteria bacterium]
MFTGIVEEIGIVSEVKRTTQGAVLSIDASNVLTDSKIGDSIAIDGVCLTMTQADSKTFTADISAETLRRTTLGNRDQGDGVNLERSLQLNSRLGGHIVLGHVDDVGVISGWRDEGDSSMMRVSASPDVMRYVVFKGSICVDGISLTIANLFESEFEIALIPHTKQVTTIGKKRVGDRVNIEVDLLGRYVERLLGEQSQSPRSVNLAFLKSHGFA